MKTNSKSKKQRLETIVKLVSNRCISNQQDLSKLLAEEGFKVSQGTLSRDLRALKTVKVPTDRGVLMYVMPDSDTLKDKLLSGEPIPINPNYQSGFVSITFSGHMAVIKTRNGYAAGLAFDIDSYKMPEILGTIPGSDTIFAVMREDITPEQAWNVFSKILPLDQYNY